MHKPHSLSPAARLTLLELFAQGKLELTVEQYDEHFDAVTEVLGAANNESYRLHGGAEAEVG